MNICIRILEGILWHIDSIVLSGYVYAVLLFEYLLLMCFCVYRFPGYDCFNLLNSSFAPVKNNCYICCQLLHYSLVQYIITFMMANVSLNINLVESFSGYSTTGCLVGYIFIYQLHDNLTQQTPSGAMTPFWVLKVDLFLNQLNGSGVYVTQ